MSDFDPTTIQVPLGMLTLEQQVTLMAWPHGWQIFGVDGWADRPDPAWLPHLAHRGKPVSAVKTSYYNVYPNGSVGGEYGSRQEVLNAVGSESIGMICVEIVDGELKSARKVEEDKVEEEDEI